MSLVVQPVDIGTKGWTLTTKQQNDVENGLVDLNIVLATPLKALTEETLDGNGVFDVLMRTTKAHLKEEFDASRITGSDYSTVYLGSLTAVLQASTQFLVSEQQVHKLNADIMLVRQQTMSELANTDDNLPIGYALNFIPDVPTTIAPITNPGGA